MKKKNLLIATLLVVAAVSVAVVSCKKEKSSQASNLDQVAENMNEYLKSFKQKLLSAEKGEETISLKQAQRDLGNLLNYDFGDANYATNVFHEDTLRTRLVINGDMVDLAQLSATYNVAHEMIAKAYEQVNIPEKSVYSIYCAIDPEAKENETVEIVLVLTTRGLDEGMKSMNSVPTFKTSIDNTDCWHVADARGRCDNTDLGYDHCSILQLVYNCNILPLSCSSGGMLYFTDVTEETIYAYEYEDTNAPSYNLGYRLWRGFGNGWENGLVSPEEMSYYYDNLCDILDEKMEDLYAEGYTITRVSCAVHQEANGFGHNTPQYYSFVCKYEYAKHHCQGGTND